MSVCKRWSHLCREGNDCKSDGQRYSHRDDDSSGVVEGGDGSHHVGQAQGHHDLQAQRSMFETFTVSCERAFTHSLHHTCLMIHLI